MSLLVSGSFFFVIWVVPVAPLSGIPWGTPSACPALTLDGHLERWDVLHGGVANFGNFGRNDDEKNRIPLEHLYIYIYLNHPSRQHNFAWI